MPGQRAHVVHRGHVGKVACRDPRESQGCKELQEMTEHQGRKGHRVILGQQDLQVFLDHVDLQE